MAQELDEEYILEVRHKAARIRTLDGLIQSRAPNWIIKESMRSLKKSDVELQKYNRQIPLEQQIARDYFMESLEKQQTERITKKNCHACLVYQNWMSPIAERGDCPDVADAPLCYRVRTEKISCGEYLDCKEYSPNQNLEDHFFNQDAEEIQKINRLLGLIDQDLLDNYEKRLFE